VGASAVVACGISYPDKDFGGWVGHYRDKCPANRTRHQRPSTGHDTASMRGCPRARQLASHCRSLRHSGEQASSARHPIAVHMMPPGLGWGLLRLRARISVAYGGNGPGRPGEETTQAAPSPGAILERRPGGICWSNHHEPDAVIAPKHLVSVVLLHGGFPGRWS
jgi:hypothetical protein